jgi:hypothetical protein
MKSPRALCAFILFDIVMRLKILMLKSPLNSMMWPLDDIQCYRLSLLMGSSRCLPLLIPAGPILMLVRR